MLPTTTVSPEIATEKPKKSPPAASPAVSLACSDQVAQFRTSVTASPQPGGSTHPGKTLELLFGQFGNLLVVNRPLGSGRPFFARCCGAGLGNEFGEEGCECAEDHPEYARNGDDDRATGTNRL